MSSIPFAYKGNDIRSPVGSIAQYSGKTSPSGWLICDGSTVTASDGKYADLATILNSAYGVTTNNSNSITLPNLKNYFLLGASVTKTLGSKGGSSSITLTTNQLPSHNHNVSTISSPQHNHEINDPGHSHAGINYHTGFCNELQSGQAFYARNTSGNATTITAEGPLSVTHSTSSNTASKVDANSTLPTTSINSAGSGNSIYILPPYTTINYVIKY